MYFRLSCLGLFALHQCRLKIYVHIWYCVIYLSQMDTICICQFYYISFFWTTTRNIPSSSNMFFWFIFNGILFSPLTSPIFFKGTKWLIQVHENIDTVVLLYERLKSIQMKTMHLWIYFSHISRTLVKLNIYNLRSNTIIIPKKLILVPLIGETLGFVSGSRLKAQRLLVLSHSRYNFDLW